MRKFALFIFINLCALLSMSAGSETTSTPKVGIKIIKRPPIGEKQIPRMPSNQYLLFYYNGETHECVFTLREEIEYLSISIMECETGITYIGEVTQEEPVMIQTLLPGYYRITCLTDEGELYEGEGPIE